MTLTTAIVLIVIADLALIAGLAYVMSHAGRLTPHTDTSLTPVPGNPAPSPERVRPAHQPQYAGRETRTPRTTRVPSGARS